MPVAFLVWIIPHCGFALKIGKEIGDACSLSALRLAAMLACLGATPAVADWKLKPNVEPPSCAVVLRFDLLAERAGQPANVDGDVVIALPLHRAALRAMTADAASARHERH